MSRNQPVVVATTPCSLDLCVHLLSPSSLSEQFRYKRRVYAQNLIDDKQFAKLHTKVKQSLEGTFHDHCSYSGLAQSAFPEVGFRTWSGVGLRLHAQDWSSDGFPLNQSFAGNGVSAFFEAGGEGSG